MLPSARLFPPVTNPFPALTDISLNLSPMKRKSFLRTGVAALTSLVLPVAGFAKRVGKGFFVPAGKDRNESPLVLFEGDTFYSKISTNDSDGDIYMYESTRIKPGGPPQHDHKDQDEKWYILQ